MKTYEQMAEDVFRRRDAYVIRRRKKHRIIATSAMSLACTVLLMCIGMHKANVPDVTIPTLQSGPQLDDPVTSSPVTYPPNETLREENGGLTLFLAESQDSDGQELKENLNLPLNYLIAVRDIRGLDSDEIQNAFEDESASIKKYAPFWRCNTLRLRNIILSSAASGVFRLQIDDYSTVECIDIKAESGYGKVCVLLSDDTFPRGREVTLLPEQIPDGDKENFIIVNWEYDNALVEALEADPDMSLTEFYDVVTFSVIYKDGRIESCTVDIIFCDDGTVYAAYQGTILSDM